MKRVKLIVTGDVQGVFFRHFAEKEAKKYDIKGWCRNESDGSVYVIAEGEDKKVDSFVRWAKKGSPMATVEHVEITNEKYAGLERDFEIR